MLTLHITDVKLTKATITEEPDKLLFLIILLEELNIKLCHRSLMS